MTSRKLKRRNHRTRKHRHSTYCNHNHKHNASCKHNKPQNKFRATTLANINGKCYKNGRKFPCSQFVKEERKVASSMWDMFKL
jgi:hypothetical protein